MFHLPWRAQFHWQGWRTQAINKAVQLRASIREDDTGGGKKATGGHHQIPLVHKLGSHAGTIPKHRRTGRDKIDFEVCVSQDAGGRARSHRYFGRRRSQLGECEGGLDRWRDKQG